MQKITPIFKRSIFQYLFFLFIFCLSISTLASNYKSYSTTPLPGTVALTFDDGPNPLTTPTILKILKKYNVHATFFVGGKLAKKYPKLLKKMYAEGHSIGNHSLTQPILTNLSDSDLQYEISTAKQIIEKILDKPIQCFRPPHAMYDKRIEKFIARNDMKLATYFLNSFDYELPGYNRIALSLAYHAKNGTIILFHDGDNRIKAHRQIINSLPKVIKLIRKKGLGFSTICNNKEEN